MTQIRNYAIERLASTIYDDDLLDIQIMEAGSDQYEEARMKVSELRKLMNDGVTPKRYKALISQNAPIASTNNDTMVAGQIWELSGAANPSDYATIDTFELVSGTLYAAGSKYRVSVDTPFTLSASAMEYDGSPYIVSTDVNGDFAPFVNTLGGNPIWSRYTVGVIEVTLAGGFPLLKTWIRFSPPNSTDSANGSFTLYEDEGVDSNSRKIMIRTDSGVPTDGLGVKIPILVEIEVNP